MLDTKISNNNADIEDIINADLIRTWTLIPIHDGLPQNRSYNNCFTVGLLSGVY
jgi:hypothetical protein